MGDLTESMHACVGAASGGDCMVARLQFCERSLDCTLHRRLVGLTLPACERLSVVFNFERISGHGGAIAQVAGKEKRFAPLVMAQGRA